MPRLTIVGAVFLSMAASHASRADTRDAKLHIAMSFPKRESSSPLDGRMLLLISKDESREPRFQIDDGPNCQQVFGIDVDGLQPDSDAIFDAQVFGSPLGSLKDVPRGEYIVQGLLHRYETFHRADGHAVRLPMDRGEGQHWNIAPGNLYSTPRKILIDPSSEETIRISLDQEIPPIPPPQDTKYIKHVKIESRLLSKFWGQPMNLAHACCSPKASMNIPRRAIR